MPSSFILLFSLLVAVTGVMSFSLTDLAKNTTQVFRHTSKTHLAAATGYYHFEKYSGNGCTGTVTEYIIIQVGDCYVTGATSYKVQTVIGGYYKATYFSDTTCGGTYTSESYNMGSVSVCIGQHKGVLLSTTLGPPINSFKAVRNS